MSLGARSATSSSLREQLVPADSRAVRHTQKFRLADGGLLDRASTLTFRFDGRTLYGYHGDTLASALLANGVRLVGRSFKYHRPRGILAAGVEEPNALVEVRSGARREPNTRATTIELYDGLEVVSQNRWPSLRFDAMAVNSVASPLLQAGFYYKTFMWPSSFWEKIYEPLIRRAAGLGRAAREADPDEYEKVNAFCDVLVVGSGASGLAAALTAARAGARVILCEDDYHLGGRCLSERSFLDGNSAASWASSVEAELVSNPDVRVLRRTSVFGAYDGGLYAAVERLRDHTQDCDGGPRQRLWRINAKRSVLASGGFERPIVFGNNDLPGIMLAGAVRTYINRFAVVPGRRAVLFTNNDDAYRTALDLSTAGARVEAIVDPRPRISAHCKSLAHRSGARLIEGVVDRACGWWEVKSVEIRAADGTIHRLPCDLVAISGGWNPTIHLSSHLGGRPVWSEQHAAFLPGVLPPGMGVVGAAAGGFVTSECLSSGAKAGADAAETCGFTPRTLELPRTDRESTASAPLWRVVSSRGKAFVDFQNDVTVKDVELAEREGFRKVEHLKRYTTLGMATDQGKTSNVNGLAVLSEITAKAIPEIGGTTFRPPFSPVALGPFAGHHRGKNYRPTRLSPAHKWAEGEGATFVEAGLWLRAQYYPRAGEQDWTATVRREVMTVRATVGVCDVSTLGKIDVQGPDAGRFLDRVYCNTFSTLPVGKARYGLMLREDGFVMDDGTTSRLSGHHYLVTTTTANAGKVMQHLEFCCQCLWPDLDVQATSVTDHWAQFAVAGPKARLVIRKIVDPEYDVSKTALPYLAATEITIGGGVPARLFRISFSGELAFELAIPARFGEALGRLIVDAGSEFGITPYGSEALAAMRIEKGHVAGGELNGQTTARDLGLGKMMSTKKDYIGRVMAERPALLDPNRPELVGLKPEQPDQRLHAGAHLIPRGGKATPDNDQGYTSSAVYSPTLGHWIALGLLVQGPKRHGELLCTYDPLRGLETLVRVCAPTFVDPTGDRLRA